MCKNELKILAKPLPPPPPPSSLKYTRPLPIRMYINNHLPPSICISELSFLFDRKKMCASAKMICRQEEKRKSWSFNCVCVCPVQKFFHLFSLISIPLLLLLSKNITYVMISSYTVSLSILVPWGLRGVKEHKPPAIFTFRESGQFFLTADTGHDQTNLSLDCREIICKCQSTTQPTTFIFYYLAGRS